MSNHAYYMIWSGSLHLGDTPGVFNNAQFVGLQVQLPLKITYVANGVDVELLLQTTDVEIYGGKKHPIYWDFQTGDPLSVPVGYIDDTDPVPNKPEYHKIIIPNQVANVGMHTLTILINPDVEAGMKDDFVLEAIQAHESCGAKIGW